MNYKISRYYTTPQTNLTPTFQNFNSALEIEKCKNVDKSAYELLANSIINEYKMVNHSHPHHQECTKVKLKWIEKNFVENWNERASDGYTFLLPRQLSICRYRRSYWHYMEVGEPKNYYNVYLSEYHTGILDNFIRCF